MVSRCVMFSRCHGEACSLFEGRWGKEVELGERGGEGAGKSGGRGSYGQDVLYERRNYERFKAIQDSLLLELVWWEEK